MERLLDQVEIEEEETVLELLQRLNVHFKNITENGGVYWSRRLNIDQFKERFCRRNSYYAWMRSPKERRRMRKIDNKRDDVQWITKSGYEELKKMIDGTSDDDDEELPESIKQCIATLRASDDCSRVLTKLDGALKREQDKYPMSRLFSWRDDREKEREALERVHRHIVAPYDEAFLTEYDAALDKKIEIWQKIEEKVLNMLFFGDFS